MTSVPAAKCHPVHVSVPALFRHLSEAELSQEHHRRGHALPAGGAGLRPSLRQPLLADSCEQGSAIEHLSLP